MPVVVNCETEKGGAVTLNEAHNVRASYAVATAGDLPPPETLYVSVDLPDGRTVGMFVNRESGLVVIDLTDKNGRSGRELLRRYVDRPSESDRPWQLLTTETPKG